MRHQRGRGFSNKSGQWPFGILCSANRYHASVGNSLGATHPLQRQAYSPYVKQTARRVAELVSARRAFIGCQISTPAACVNTREKQREREREREKREIPDHCTTMMFPVEILVRGNFGCACGTPYNGLPPTEGSRTRTTELSFDLVSPSRGRRVVR